MKVREVEKKKTTGEQKMTGIQAPEEGGRPQISASPAYDQPALQRKKGVYPLSQEAIPVITF